MKPTLEEKFDNGVRDPIGPMQRVIFRHNGQTNTTQFAPAYPSLTLRGGFVSAFDVHGDVEVMATEFRSPDYGINRRHTMNGYKNLQAGDKYIVTFIIEDIKWNNPQ